MQNHTNTHQHTNIIFTSNKNEQKLKLARLMKAVGEDNIYIYIYYLAEEH